MSSHQLLKVAFCLFLGLTCAYPFFALDSLYSADSSELLTAVAFAQGENDEAEKEEAKTEDAAETDAAAKPVADLTDEELLARWSELKGKREAIAQELVNLNKEFKKAKPEEQKEIRKKYAEQIETFEKEVRPALVEIADRVATLNPDDADAIEIAVLGAWNKNQYQKIADWTRKLYDAGRKTKTILNYGGVAHFALHDFETAKAWLTEADTDLLLDPTIGGRYLEDAAEYVEFWKAEQAVREKEDAAPEAEQNPRVLIKTSKGDVLIELFENEAPNTVANFISLVESKAYDGMSFHRVIPNFMIQGGDPNSKDADPGNDGQGGPGYTIDCECYSENARKHFSGSLSMAHRGKDTGGSQFFITHLPTSHLNTNAEQKRGHTVFGRVVEGLDIVRSIQMGDLLDEATVVRKRDHEYKPVKN